MTTIPDKLGHIILGRLPENPSSLAALPMLSRRYAMLSASWPLYFLEFSGTIPLVSSPSVFCREPRMTVTLADCMPAFLDDMTYLVRLRPHTLRAYRYELTAAARALPVPLNQLTICDLERWIARDHVAASTVARRIATLSRFFTWAVHHQYCLTN